MYGLQIPFLNVAERCHELHYLGTDLTGVMRIGKRKSHSCRRAGTGWATHANGDLPAVTSASLFSSFKWKSRLIVYNWTGWQFQLISAGGLLRGAIFEGMGSRELLSDLLHTLNIHPSLMGQEKFRHSHGSEALGSVTWPCSGPQHGLSGLPPLPKGCFFFDFDRFPICARNF